MQIKQEGVPWQAGEFGEFGECGENGNFVKIGDNLEATIKCKWEGNGGPLGTPAIFVYM